MRNNIVPRALAVGGAIKPLLISAADSNGLGLCNPSIFIDAGVPWLILRNVGYTLYHTENEQRFNSRYGPLSYLNPENDLHLRTTNFLCRLNSELDIEWYQKIDTSTLDTPPLWEFVGLEDARLVRWNEKLYAIGVRRDTTTNGQGRMELSELEVTEESVREVARFRIEHPTDPSWYCEKNWMPVLDRPYQFIHFSNPPVLLEADLATLKSRRIFTPREEDVVPDLPFTRGGSQVLPWRGGWLCVVHECDLFKNRIGEKDAKYRHRFIRYDADWHTLKISEPFSFMDGRIEFCAGAAFYNDNLLLTFGYEDNCAFILRLPEKLLSELVGVE